MRVAPTCAPDAWSLNAADLAADLKQILGKGAYVLSQAETTPRVLIRPLGDDFRGALTDGEISGGDDMVADTIYAMSHDFDENVVPEMAAAAQLLGRHAHQLNVAQSEKLKDGTVTITTVLYGVTTDNQLLGIVFERYGEYC